MPAGERLLWGARRAYAATAGRPLVVAAVAATGIAAGAVAVARLSWTLVTGLALVPSRSAWPASCSDGSRAST